MAALLGIVDSYAQERAKSDVYFFPSLTDNTVQFKKELDRETEETSMKDEDKCLDFPFGDRTYPELKSIVSIGSRTGLPFPYKPLERDESYGSLASAISYSREEVINHLERISDILAEVKEEFDDKENRQIFFFEVKEHLVKLWEIEFPGNKYFQQSISLLEDSLFYTKSEDLSTDQVDGFMDVIEICRKIDISIDDARICGRILRSKKIATLPILK